MPARGRTSLRLPSGRGLASVSNITFSRNSALNGGGIGNGGTLSVTNNSFSGNTAVDAGNPNGCRDGHGHQKAFQIARISHSERSINTRFPNVPMDELAQCRPDSGGIGALSITDLLRSKTASTDAAPPGGRRSYRDPRHGLVIGTPSSYQLAATFRTLSLNHSFVVNSPRTNEYPGG